MEGLLKCIGDIPEGQKSEHIVVTGDIVWFGKRDEYDEAKIWFLRLLEVTGLKGKDLTFCVGNHDVNWSYGQIIDELTDETISFFHRKKLCMDYHNGILVVLIYLPYSNFAHKIQLCTLKIQYLAVIQLSLFNFFKQLEVLFSTRPEERS